VETHQTRISGTIEAFGAAAALLACGYGRAQDLGAVSTGGLSLLEQLLSGRFFSALPDAPGLSPDVDADGDGLERFTLDDDDRIVRCIDGDGFTVIEGRDCWQDPRIVDGFGLVVGLELVRGRLVGRGPGWEYDLEGACEGGGLDGLFDFGEPGPGCAELDEVCDPRSAAPCCDPAQRCSGASRIDYRCLGSCDAAPCAYGARVGSCISGACWPLERPEARVSCTPGEPCTTEYGEDDGTVCVRRDDRTLCVETCLGAPGECGDERHECLPVMGEDAGVCAFFDI
jgi:hypothetical protein